MDEVISGQLSVVSKKNRHLIDLEPLRNHQNFHAKTYYKGHSTVPPNNILKIQSN